MPYITKDRRERYIDIVQNLFINDDTVTAGEINYLLTEIIASFTGPELSYEKINTVIGILECCKLELYRRLSAYEDIKLRQNGDTTLGEFVNNYV